MAPIIKVLALVLCIALFCEGIESFRCNPGIVISQAKLNGTIQEQQIWNVTVANTCDCVQLQVKLNIPNFNSIIQVNTTIISKSHDDVYVVNGGLPIYPHTSVFFTYAADKSLDITTNDRFEACS